MSVWKLDSVQYERELAELKSSVTMKERVQLKGHSNTVYALAWNRNGMLATGSVDKSARVYDFQNRVPSGSDELVLLGHTSAITSLAWSPSPSHPHELCTGSRDSSARLWDTRTGKQTTLLPTPNPLLTTTYLTPSRLCLTDMTDTARLFDLRRPADPLAVHSFGTQVNAVAWTQRGLAVAAAGGMRVYRVEDEVEEVARVKAGKGDVYCIAEGGGIIATGGADESLLLWDAATLTCTAAVSVPAPIVSASFSSSRSLLAAGGDAPSATLYHAPSGTPLTSIPTGPLSALAFSPGGALACAHINYKAKGGVTVYYE